MQLGAAGWARSSLCWSAPLAASPSAPATRDWPPSPAADNARNIFTLRGAWQTERIYAYNGLTKSPAEGQGGCKAPLGPLCNGTGGWWQAALGVRQTSGAVWDVNNNYGSLMGLTRSLKVYGEFFGQQPETKEWWVTGQQRAEQCGAHARRARGQPTLHCSSLPFTAPKCFEFGEISTVQTGCKRAHLPAPWPPQV